MRYDEFCDVYELKVDAQGGFCLLGEGAFGIVHEAVDRKNAGSQCAVKAIRLVSRKMDQIKVIQEKRCMVRLKKHPNVVDFYNYSIGNAGGYRE